MFSRSVRKHSYFPLYFSLPPPSSPPSSHEFQAKVYCNDVNVGYRYLMPISTSNGSFEASMNFQDYSKLSNKTGVHGRTKCLLHLSTGVPGRTKCLLHLTTGVNGRKECLPHLRTGVPGRKEMFAPPENSGTRQ